MEIVAWGKEIVGNSTGVLLGEASGLGNGDSGDILLECCRVEIAMRGMGVGGTFYCSVPGQR